MSVESIWMKWYGRLNMILHEAEVKIQHVQRQVLHIRADAVEERNGT